MAAALERGRAALVGPGWGSGLRLAADLASRCQRVRPAPGSAPRPVPRPATSCPRLPRPTPPNPRQQPKESQYS